MAERPVIGRGRGRGRGVRENKDKGIFGTFSSSINLVTEPEGVVESSASLPELGLVSKRELPQPSTDDDRLGNELHEIRLDLEHVQVFPKRPGFGAQGRKIRLISNWFRLRIPSGCVYHYDVDIVDKGKGSAGSTQDRKFPCSNKKLNRLIMNSMFENSSEFKDLFPVYDGKKNMYTRYPLPGVPLDKEVSLARSDELEIPLQFAGTDGELPKKSLNTYVVSVKPVVNKVMTKGNPQAKQNEVKCDSEWPCAIDLDTIQAFFDGKIQVVPQVAIVAVETILRNTPSLNLTPIGRSFFRPPEDGKQYHIGSNQELWFGYHQSLRIGKWPAVNIDISTTRFYEKAPILDYVCSILNLKRESLQGKTQFSDKEIDQLNAELQNLKVRTNYLPKHQRKYRIFKIINESANTLKLEVTSQNGFETVSVKEYFEKRYSYVLKYPHFPCLQMTPEKKCTFLPLEACEVVDGQPHKKELSDNQKRELIKFTTVLPIERFKRINDIVKKANFNDDVFCKEFGLVVDSSPIEVEGRVIGAPVLRYEKQLVLPVDGQWDMRNKQFLKPAQITNWIVLSIFGGCSYVQMKNFASELMCEAKILGINIAEPSEIRSVDEKDTTQADLQKLFSTAKNKYGDCLAVIILPRQPCNMYAEIKKAAEIFAGLRTQCLRSINVCARKPSFLKNLCLKINAKMGGTNCLLDQIDKFVVFQRPVIIIGADVTHYGPLDSKQSIAAVVGSLDEHASFYSVACTLQSTVHKDWRPVEIILDLKRMVVEVLRAFYKSTNGKKPERIIFYRDGVGEGQLSQVRQYEVRAVRDACRTLSVDYQPGITYVIVQKRHHTRFRPIDIHSGAGRAGNIPPGTTVDTTLGHPRNFDFFLCSHFGMQGTSRPAHYTVLEDDNGFEADELQKMTYHLCYSYVRCTKSISIPAPVMYAHLAAFRARQHIASNCINSAAINGNQSIQIKVTDALRNAMYFV